LNESRYVDTEKIVGERGKMHSTLSYPFGKLDFKATILVPLLIISMFTMLPMVTAQVAPNIGKISPMLLSEMANAGESVNVLIKTVSNDYSSVVQQISDLGGKVGYLFKYVSGLSASLPTNKIIELTQNDLVERIYYDTPRQLASDPNVSVMDNLLASPTVESESFDTVAFTNEMLTSVPKNYWDTIGMGAQATWPETNMGAGSLAVVIDSGIWLGHFMFRSKVALGEIAGGIDLSSDVGNATYEGWDNPNNYWHGSHVAGTIASRGGIIVNYNGTSSLVKYCKALESYSGIPLPQAPGYPASYKVLWLLGMAPAASLYIIKVFSHTGVGVPTSTIINGMEHALDLKVTQGMDVDLVSMSIGGPTVFDGRDMEDSLVDTMTANGITLVAAAGNEGPAPMTVSSPGSGNTAITAGAAADPVHTKSFFDYHYQSLGIGSYLFTSPTAQIIDFSSRGPTSDGRTKPTLSATGVFVLSAYPTGGIQAIAWGSGTSMATPAISGATALLNAYSEMHNLSASPEDFREALTASATLLPGYQKYDQGAGYLNATTALAALKADTHYGDVARPLLPFGWLKDITNIPIITKGLYTTTITNLAPGHTVNYVFQVTDTTDSIKVDVTNIALGANPLGANSLDLYIQSAKRTTGDYYVKYAYMLGDSSFYITNYVTTATGTFYPNTVPETTSHQIEPGYVKVVLVNDFESYDSASAKIKITVTKAWKTAPSKSIYGCVRQGHQFGWVSIPVPAGTTKAIVELWWIHDWSTYPTSDLDLYVIVNGALNVDGATLNSPERAILIGPTGTIYLLVDGYEIHTWVEAFQIRITFV
jgi:hypothetical protein